MRSTQKSAARVMTALVAVCVLATDAYAQKLSIEGDRFVVDGQPRFLTFLSMFGLMGAPDISGDLQTVKKLGFDGFRIWPNLDTAPQLFDSDGSLRPAAMDRLRSIVDVAQRERLIVDISFTYEHTPGLTPARVRQGIVAVTDALRGYGNLLFDIQNERNVTDRRHMSETDVRTIFAAIKSRDPSRVTTASNSPVDTPEFAAAFAARLGLDVTAYHEPRPPDWYTLETIQKVVRAMKANGRPAYLQEPMSTRNKEVHSPSNDRAEYFRQALAHARQAGAAAWCFHTRVALDYREGPARLEDRLRLHAEPEWAFVTSFKTP